jgi:hypothetical protein
MKQSFKALLAVVGLLAFSSCEVLQAIVPILLKSYTLTVQNYCGGANTTVDVYVDGVYKKTIYERNTITNISEGTRNLKAVGTGAGGYTFTTSTYFNADKVWTLCSNGASNGASSKSNPGIGTTLNSVSP